MTTNDIYYVEDLGTPEITYVVDDGGIDWLCIRSIHKESSRIDLDRFLNYGGGLDHVGLAQISDSIFEPSRDLAIIGIVENARGANGNDTIEGNYYANILFGDSRAVGAGGKDILYGEEDNDTIYGGGGNDVIEGGYGSDQIFGGTGNDKIYSDGKFYNGSANPDTIEGGAGADTIIGMRAQTDFVFDTISYLHSSAGIAIKLDAAVVTFGSGGDAEGDQVSGFAHIIGSDYADQLTANYSGKGIDSDLRDNALYGRGGNDTLGGGNGNDTLTGGAGRDWLTGGTDTDSLVGANGADRFIFNATAESNGSASRDTIADFSHREHDKIDLSAIDAIAYTSGKDHFTFVGALVSMPPGQPQVYVPGHLSYIKVQGGIVLVADVDGDNKVDFSLLLQGIARIEASDFILS